MRLSLVCLSVLLWAAPVLAQAPGDEPAPPPPPAPPAGPPAEPMPPPPPPVVAPIVAPAPPPEAPSTVDPGTLEDANAGRVAIMPTALTPPKGAFSFEDWELFLISASYGVSDNLVISATTMVPVTSDAYWGFLSAKLQIIKQGRVRVAVQAGAAAAATKDTTTTFDSMGNIVSQMSTTTTGGLFDLGGALTYCLDDGCNSHADAALAAAFAEQDNSSVPVGFMGGIVLKVASKVRLIAEADTAHLFGKLNDQADGFLGWYGVRFTSRNIGVDLTLVKPFCGGTDCDTDTFPLGFPFVTFAYRAL